MLKIKEKEISKLLDNKNLKIPTLLVLSHCKKCVDKNKTKKRKKIRPQLRSLTFFLKLVFSPE